MAAQPPPHGPSANAEPPKLKITNLDANPEFSDGELWVQFNPSVFSENLSANYGRLAVLGLSHQPMEYLNTSNLTTPMEFTYLVRGEDTLSPVASVKKFFFSLCYPSEDAWSVSSGSPPRALIVWPFVVSMTTKLTSLKIINQRFNNFGMVVQLGITCMFEQIRDVRWTSEDAIKHGRTPVDPRPYGGLNSIIDRNRG